MNTYYIVVSKVINPDAYENAVLGQPEYQFSDGPRGDRSMSEDFLSIEEGIRALGPAIFLMAD